MRTKMKTVTTRVPDDFYNWLKENSKETGLPIAHFIRKCLKELRKIYE